MEFSDDPEKLLEWIPLMLKDRELIYEIQTFIAQTLGLSGEQQVKTE